MARRVLTTFAALGLLLAACSDPVDEGSTPAETTGPLDPVDPVASAPPLIVVTTSVLGDVVSSIVAGDATVEVLMPPGVDPHDFEPSARQAASMRDATAVVANGLGLEVGLDGALASARDDGVTVIDVGEMIEPLPFGATTHAHGERDHGDDRADDHGHDDDHADDHGHDDDHADDHGHDDDHADDDGHDDDGHDHGDDDPHFWHDPLRMADAVPGMVDALVAAAPVLDTPELRQRADDYVDMLIELDAEVAAILDEVPESRRYLLTNHDTFGYLAARYDFEVIGSVIPGGDTLAQPSLGSLAALVREIEAHDVRAIFAENVLATDLVEALARETTTRVEVVTLYTDSLGEPGSGADTYRGMLQTNARLIADALSG
jgi:zinc/manganese transport system substrate-binding protein